MGVMQSYTQPYPSSLGPAAGLAALSGLASGSRQGDLARAKGASCSVVMSKMSASATDTLGAPVG
jgi:hypothetical protein